MDPVSIILSALAAGALAGAQSSATEAVKDAYTGLKEMLRYRFGEVALAQHESKPEQWGPALQAELVEVQAGEDPATVAAAQRLMALLDPAGTKVGKYNVDLRGAQGVQVGDRNVQTNTFTSSRTK